jgi:phospholipid transport system substrate-binding protein
MKKTGIWLIAVLLVWSNAIAAQAAEASATAAPSVAQAGSAGAQAGNPAVQLRAGIDRLLTFLSREPAPEESEFADFLDTEIAPFFDFDYMAKTAGGRLFERLSAEQRAEITGSIKASFLGKMAEKLTGYTDQQVRFLPPRAGAGGRTAQVSAAILNPGSYPARLDFRLYRSGDNWRVYDVAANGQSAIVHYRRQLMRQVQERRMREMRVQGRPPMAPGRPPMGMPMGRPMVPQGPTGGYGTPYRR